MVNPLMDSVAYRIELIRLEDIEGFIDKIKKPKYLHMASNKSEFYFEAKAPHSTGNLG